MKTTMITVETGKRKTSDSVRFYKDKGYEVKGVFRSGGTYKTVMSK